MVGIIRRREQIKEPPGPDDYFDPVTHIATEENFIKFLQAGIYTEDVIGYKVQLENSVDYNNGLWIVADVNHDSENTGQSNCYDLISEDCFHSTSLGSHNWRSSTARTWLNNTFYPGFSTEFKNHILNPKYKSISTWYTDDKIILPSYKELNCSGYFDAYQDNEGTAYPIFTNDTSRIKNHVWWTRSRYTGSSTGVFRIDSSGSTRNYGYSNNYYLAPLLRVS